MPIRTLFFTILVPGTVTVIAPYVLLSADPFLLPLPLRILRYGGVPLILLGAGAYLRCAWDFAFTGRGTPAPIAPPETLVVGGLYRFVRNPMYLGIVTILVGEAVLFESPVLFGYAALAALLFHLFVVFSEEPSLRRRFGAEYEAYRASVPRWFPRHGRDGPPSRSPRRPHQPSIPGSPPRRNPEGVSGT